MKVRLLPFDVELLRDHWPGPGHFEYCALLRVGTIVTGKILRRHVLVGGWGASNRRKPTDWDSFRQPPAVN
jgi:hypothetical protein